MQQDIFDERNGCYQIDLPDPARQFTPLYIYRKKWRGKQKAGEVSLFWKDAHVLVLSNIELESRFRNRGLGSAVLKFIFEIARSHGIETIEGCIVAKDARASPFLSAFYRKHGFVLEAIGPDHELNKKSSPYSAHIEARRHKTGTSRSDDHQKIYLITKSLIED